MTTRPIKALVFNVDGRKLSTRSSKPEVRKEAKRLARKYEMTSGKEESSNARP